MLKASHHNPTVAKSGLAGIQVDRQISGSRLALGDGVVRNPEAARDVVVLGSVPIQWYANGRL
jgi:hypothetical protein